jgi:capsular polysaccharide transport system permease protein
LQQEKLNLDYAVLSKKLNELSPSLVNLKARIDAGAEQIRDLEGKLTASSGGDEVTLSSSMTRLARLDLEKQVAEKLYAGAATSLEISKLIAEQQLMYLNIFVKPEEPVKGIYPRRVLNSAAVVLASLALWGVLYGLLMLARNHMA